VESLVLRPVAAEKATRLLRVFILVAVAGAVVAFLVARPGPPGQHGPVAIQKLRGKPSQPAKVPYLTPAPRVVVYQSEAQPAPGPHPKHVVKTWLTSYGGRIFRVTQLPRCEHVEAIIARNPKGETKEEAMHRLGGAAVSTGAFHNPDNLELVDFVQQEGAIVSEATTGRWFLAIFENGALNISDNYMMVKGKSGVSALALGQRLVPLHQDGFSKSFMNAITDRMALGLSHDYIFITQGRSSIWTLADFIKAKLPVTIALNADGGHVVKGRAPVHVVFRGRNLTPPTPGQQAAAPEVKPRG
jgi:hypothetical protein